MKYHFFTIQAQSPEVGQAELNQFCSEHHVVGLDKQFVAHGFESFWSICVTVIQNSPVKSIDKRARIDYKEILNTEDFAVYAELRNLRKEISEQEGVPAYALFTNEQLAQIVTSRAKTLTELSNIEGVGKARLEKYGVSFLDLHNKILSKDSDIR